MSGNKTFYKIGGFVLVVVGIFVTIGNTIPGSQIASYPPHPLDKDEFSKMTQDQIVDKGRQVFGTGGERCSQCHIIGEGTPGRCPNLAGVGSRAATRRPGFTAEAYILTHLVEPKDYTVPGYPPIMPEVYKPPLDLSEYDILAVAAFLESQGGTVTITNKSALKPEWSQRITASKSIGATPPPKGDLANGKRLFYQRMRCMACHKTTVDGQKVGGVLGPDLSGIGLIQGPDYLLQSIVDPSAVVVAPYKDIMPKHFRENLTDQELNDLVVFLLSQRSSS